MSFDSGLHRRTGSAKMTAVWQDCRGRCWGRTARHVGSRGDQKYATL